MKAFACIFALLLCLGGTGCDNLAHGTRLKPLARSDFFDDHASARLPPLHSIARGELHADTLLYSGRGEDGKLSAEFPWPVTATVLARGQVQYEAICANCHGADGYGHGIIVRRGFPQPPSLHDDEQRKAPAGHFFDVITNGHGAMYPYAGIVAVNDRWAIAAYVRALQRSQQASTGDVPPAELAKLNQEPSP